MKGLELFCGAGGASLGLRRAGIESVLHVDCDEDACTTMVAAGFDGVVREYVQYLKPEHLPSGVLFWWASPPCPAWSSAGMRRGAKDGRNGYPHLFRALALKGPPKWLVIEQVEGISFHKGGCPTRRGGAAVPDECPGCYLHAVVLPSLREFFPVVQMSVLDAADYGVPQHRNRLLTVCGPSRVPWPTPSHSGSSLDEAKASGSYWKAIEDGSLFSGRDLGRGSDGCHPHRTMRQVLPALREAAFVIGGGRHPVPGEQRSYSELTDRPSTTIAAQSGGGAGNAGPFVMSSGSRKGKGPLFRSVDELSFTVSTAGDLYQTDGPDWRFRASGPDEPSRTVGTKGNAGVSFRDQDGRLFYVKGSGRSASEPERADLPSPTVSTSEAKGTRASESTDFDFNGGPDRASDAAFLAVGRRRLDLVECAILQDFPADWPFQGTKTSVYAQIGNACPDRLVSAVVREVVRADRRGSR